jgi:hypothetical protein
VRRRRAVQVTTAEDREVRPVLERRRAESARELSHTRSDTGFASFPGLGAGTRRRTIELMGRRRSLARAEGQAALLALLLAGDLPQFRGL